MLVSRAHQFYWLKTEFEILKARLDSAENVSERHEIAERLNKVVSELTHMIRGPEESLDETMGDSPDIRSA
jgi:hypothetical protein